MAVYESGDEDLFQGVDPVCDPAFDSYDDALNNVLQEVGSSRYLPEEVEHARRLLANFDDIQRRALEEA